MMFTNQNGKDRSFLVAMATMLSRGTSMKISEKKKIVLVSSFKVKIWNHHLKIDLCAKYSSIRLEFGQEQKMVDF